MKTIDFVYIFFNYANRLNVCGYGSEHLQTKRNVKTYSSHLKLTVKRVVV